MSLTFDQVIASVRELARSAGPPLRLRCHPSVVEPLRASAPEPDWPPFTGKPLLGTIDVIVTTELPPGGWELLRGDEVFSRSAPIP